MCKLQAAEVHMHHKHATSQDVSRQFMTSFSKLLLKSKLKVFSCNGSNLMIYCSMVQHGHNYQNV